MIGKYCRLESKILCNITAINLPECPFENNFSFVSEYKGIPSCIKIETNELYFIEVFKA